jgi:hypothetical protein
MLWGVTCDLTANQRVELLMRDRYAAKKNTMSDPSHPFFLLVKLRQKEYLKN